MLDLPDENLTLTSSELQEEMVKDWRARIVIHPQALVAKPIVKGTRLAVEFVIDLLAQGWTEAEIMRNYPGLTHEDVQACLSLFSTGLYETT